MLTIVSFSQSDIYFIQYPMNQIQTKTFEIVRITWSESQPFKFDSTILLPSEEKFKYFIYQIYGQHPVYGQSVLLYIGKTERLSNRIKEHGMSKFSRGLELSIRLGVIEDLEGLSKAECRNQMSKVEVLLIASLKPAYNSSAIMNSNLLKSNPPFLIQNLANRGALPLECSSIWWNDPSPEVKQLKSV